MWFFVISPCWFSLLVVTGPPLQVACTGCFFAPVEMMRPAVRQRYACQKGK